MAKGVKLRVQKGGLARAVHGISAYRSNAALKAYSIIHPLMGWVGMNAASLYFGNMGLQYVNDHAQDHRTFAVGAAWGAFIGLEAAVLKLSTNAMSKWAWRYDARHARGETSTGWSMIRTMAAGATLFGMLTSYSFQQAVRNEADDLQRALQGLSRVTIEAPKPETVQEVSDVLPEYPLRQDGVLNTGALAGKNIVNLNVLYTGISGIAPAQVSGVDFSRQLEMMWDRKITFMKNHGLMNQTAQRFHDERFPEYASKRPTLMTLDQYLNLVDNAMGDVKQNFNWNRLRELEHLNDQQLELLRPMAESLNGNDLVSYGLTELMPSSSGELNKALLDYMLRNAGREYVETIPSMSDGLTSFGLFQFTYLALSESPGQPLGGASLVNRALPEGHRIPGSVIELRGTDHYKAAYLFAIHNLAQLIRHLDRSEFDTLASTWADKKLDIVEYVATAHHAPGGRTIRGYTGAMGAAKRWLDNDASLEYKVSCKGDLPLYALKTRENMKALYRSN